MTARQIVREAMARATNVPVTEELLMAECDTIVELLRTARSPLEAYCIMEEWQQMYEDWRKIKALCIN